MRTCEVHGLTFSVGSCPVCAVEAQHLELVRTTAKLADAMTALHGEVTELQRQLLEISKAHNAALALLAERVLAKIQ